MLTKYVSLLLYFLSAEVNASGENSNQPFVDECLGSFPRIENGSIRLGSSRIGANRRISCDFLFKLQPQDSFIVCKSDGQWHFHPPDTTPSCKAPPTCPELKLAGYTFEGQGNAVGSSRRVSCRNGMKLSDIVCMIDGTWSPIESCATEIKDFSFTGPVPLNSSEGLFVSIDNNDLSTCRHILEQFGNAIDIDNQEISAKGRTPLTFASKLGRLEIVKLLLRYGADIGQQDSFGNTPLMTAVTWNQTDVVAYLLEKGAALNTQHNFTGEYPITVAAFSNYLEVAKLLLKAGSEVNIVSRNGMSPLQWSSYSGFAEMTQLLIEHGADPDYPNIHGATPLILASNMCRREIVKLLLQRGASANISALDGTTALLTAIEAQSANIETIAVLLDQIPRIDLEAKRIGSSETALAIAARLRRRDIVEMLLRAGANTSECHHDLCSDLPYLKYASTRSVSRGCGSPFNTCISSKDREVDYLGPTSSLISAGEDTAKIDDILKSYTSTYRPLLYFLIKTADLNMSFTFCHIVDSYLEAIDERRVVNFTSRDDAFLEERFSLIHLVIARESPRMLECLLKAQADVDQRDPNGDTPLMKAAAYGYLKGVQTLLQRNASIDLANKEGHTALMKAAMAVEGQHVEVLGSLLAAGAAIDMKSLENRTALEYALLNKISPDALVEKFASRESISSETIDLEPIFEAAISNQLVNMTDLLQHVPKGSINSHWIPNKASSASCFSDDSMPIFNGSLLHYAIKCGVSVEIVETLLTRVVRIDEREHSCNYTPLAYAVASHNLALSMLLLDRGASIHASFCPNGTVKLLDLALHQDSDGSSETLKRMIMFLLDKGASDQIDQALSVALSKNLTDAVELLSESRRSNFYAGSMFLTPLMWASQVGNVKRVRSLLTLDVLDINAKDSKGWTALFYAVSEGHEEVARLLIGQGAEANLTDKEGKTPLELAKSRDLENIARLLEQSIPIIL